MIKYCRRITAWFLCAVMVFMEMAPSVYADDVVEPVVTERDIDYDVSANELAEYSPEWFERYGVDTDIVFLNAETGDIYDVDMTAYDQGIRNGTQLILI